MWPFEKQAPAVDLAAITAPALVNVEVRVVSPNDVTSPVTGMRAAAFVVELVSRRFEGSETFASKHAVFEAVASLVVGDRVELAAAAPTPDAPEIVAMLRRMQLTFRTECTGGHPLTTAPPELVPLLGKVPFGGTACFREHAVVQGDRMRLCAVVERSMITVPSASYRSGTRSVLVVRDDLGPAALEELFEATFEGDLRR